MTGSDPFGVAALREATVGSWVSSPTRLREDIATERDLITVGYRDRVCTELIANAADAATTAGTNGVVAVWAAGRELHVANAGAPLTAAGVASLTALRVSAKNDADQVGRYGVGFSATAAVADRVEIRSRSGSIEFDAERTRTEVRSAGLDVGDVPVLRLAWTTRAVPADGYDTEVVLYLRDDVSASDLIAGLDADAADLLIELPVLIRLSVDGVEFSATRDVVRHGRCVTIRRESGDTVTQVRWLEVSRPGIRWAIQISDDTPVICDRDVLRAPTPTDIELSLPARCIADLPLTADRRRLHPSADIGVLAQAYPDLVELVEPRWRPLLVPGGAMTVGAEDARLTEAILEVLREHAWVPAADGADLMPARAVLIPDLTDDLAAVLAPIMGDLVHQHVSGPSERTRLRRVGVAELGWAALAERLTGVDREPGWWHEVYAALSPAITSSSDADELGALPVPRSGGRMNIGARGLFITGIDDVTLPWMATVAADAFHPLLERLGVEHVSATEVLAHPALRAMIDASEDADDDELDALARSVVGVVAADPDAAVPDWLGTLLLPDSDGDFSPADELLLPGSPIAALLVDDSPFGLVDAEFADTAGIDCLRRIGAGWGFMTVRDELPVGPDHDLPDEQRWWDALDEPPEVLVAVRDLDLVDKDKWDAALSLMVADEQIAPLLADRDGYTAWWLRHHAAVGGHRLGWYRAPSDTTFAGLLEPLDHPHADDLVGALAGPAVDGVADAEVLIDHLADAERVVAPGVVIRAYAALVDAVRARRLDTSEIAVPEQVRAIDGSVTDDALVVDHPWMVQVVPPDRMVLAGGVVEPRGAAILADLLDLPLAADVLSATVLGEGTAYTADCVDAVLLAATTGREIDGPLVRVHDDLVVETRWHAAAGDGGAAGEHSVSWWIDDRGVTHLRRQNQR